MDDKTLAWKKFEHSGNVFDYLNYRFKENKEDELLNCFNLENSIKSQGASNELGSKRNNNKRKGF